MVEPGTVPAVAPQVPPWPGWGRVIGGACLWLGIRTAGMGLLASGAYVVFTLAHHAAPAGGGG